MNDYINSNNINNDPLMDSQIKHHQKEIEYNKYINENLEKYDQKFVDFYRNGIIIYNNYKYPVNDLYIETGNIDGQGKNFLIYYKSPENDILTGELKENFIRTAVMPLNNSYLFYILFRDFKKIIDKNIFELDIKSEEYFKKLIREFDGRMHVEVPEIAYGRIND